MRSRYSAYAAGESRYIIATTHPDNPDYREADKAWREEIDLFCQHTVFLGLEIMAFVEGETEATVTFKAKLSSGGVWGSRRSMLRRMISWPISAA